MQASASPVLVGADTLLLAFPDGKLDALNLAGHVLWQRGVVYPRGASDIEHLVDIDATPIVRNGVMYIGSYQGYVGALSFATGDILWRKDASVYHNIAIRGNTLYFTDSDDVVWALALQEGQVRWKQVDLGARGLTEPVLMDANILVGDRLGWLHIMDSHIGSFLGRWKLPGPIIVPPVVHGKHIYVASAGSIYCFKIRHL